MKLKSSHMPQCEFLFQKGIHLVYKFFQKLHQDYVQVAVFHLRKEGMVTLCHLSIIKNMTINCKTHHATSILQLIVCYNTMHKETCLK